MVYINSSLWYNRPMNEHDRANLEFIMSLNEEDFVEWFNEITFDDLQYASELLQQAHLKLDVKVAEIFDDVKVMSEANQVLKRFML